MKRVSAKLQRWGSYTFIVTECQLAAATCQITCDLVRTNCRANRIVCSACCMQHIDTSGQVKIDCTACVCLNAVRICLLLHEVILVTCMECGLWNNMALFVLRLYTRLL